MLSEPIITNTEDANVGQNSHSNEITINKYNLFMKTYKIVVSFKLNNDFSPLINSTVSKPISTLSAQLPCTTASRSFLDKVSVLSFKYLPKGTNKTFPRAIPFFSGNFVLKQLTILSNHLYLTLLITLQLNSNITLYVNLSCHLNTQLLMTISHLCPCVIKLMYLDLYFVIQKFLFQPKPCLPLLTTDRSVTVCNVINPVNYSTSHLASVSIHALQCKVSLGTFLIRDMKRLQALLCHYQIYFLLLNVNHILHFQLSSLIFQQDLHFLLKPHLLETFSMCLHQLNSACFL